MTRIRDYRLHILDTEGLPLSAIANFPIPIALERITQPTIQLLKELLAPIPPNQPVVIVSDKSLFDEAIISRLPNFEHYFWLIVDDSRVLSENLIHALDRGIVSDIVDSTVSPKALQISLTKILRYYEKRYEFDEVKTHLRRLNKIAIALSTEQNIENVLDSILRVALELTDADSGTLYFLETKEKVDLPVKVSSKNKQMRFIYTKNYSIGTDPIQNQVMDITPTSLAGYCALNGETLEFNDVYQIEKNLPYSFNRSFDQKSGYRTKSMLVVPLKNHRREIIGVLQLINKKSIPGVALTTAEITEKVVIPFSDFDKEISESFGSQAAVAFENKQLFSNLQEQFQRTAQTLSEKFNSLVSLVSGIAHEVNNPINYISNSIQPLRTDVSEVSHIISVLASLKVIKREDIASLPFPDHLQDLKEVILRLIDYAKGTNLAEISDEIEVLSVIIEKGAAKITGIVRSLMSFSLLIESTLQQVDLKLVTDMAVQSLEKDLGRKLPVTIQFAGVTDLESNADMLHIVLTNILRNSVQAIPDTGGQIGIAVNGNDDYVTITIRDNGPGIPETVAARIFEAFYTTNEQKGNIGMGLFVAYNMIQRLNGVLKYQPAPEKGSLFTIYLPVSQANLNPFL